MQNEDLWEIPFSTPNLENFANHVLLSWFLCTSMVVSDSSPLGINCSIWMGCILNSNKLFIYTEFLEELGPFSLKHVASVHITWKNLSMKQQKRHTTHHDAYLSHSSFKKSFRVSTTGPILRTQKSKHQREPTRKTKTKATTVNSSVHSCEIHGDW